jgi:hypothetical protein
MLFAFQLDFKLEIINRIITDTISILNKKYNVKQGWFKKNILTTNRIALWATWRRRNSGKIVNIRLWLH